jgi:hypothetical protein
VGFERVSACTEKVNIRQGSDKNTEIRVFWYVFMLQPLNEKHLKKGLKRSYDRALKYPIP